MPGGAGAAAMGRAGCLLRTLGARAAAVRAIAAWRARTAAAAAAPLPGWPGPLAAPAVAAQSRWPLPLPQPRTAAFCTEAGTSAPSAADLEERIRELREQLQELEEKTKSVKQDAQQQVRRHQTDLDNETKFGITKFAMAMLQVPDNLERAAGSVRSEDLSQDGELRRMRDRVLQMQKAVEQALKAFGIAKMECQDQAFDPQRHEAMFAMEVPGKEPNSIFHVLEPGYQIHERTLRAAKVGVVRGAA